MKQKQFIFALVAMLSSFAFSANAQVAKEVATLPDLQEALASDANVPIVITAQIEIPAGKTVELDLNGKTVNSVFNGNSTTNHIYALSNKGTLTIQDSKGNGSINSRGIYNYGSLTLNDGAINSIDGNGGYAVNNQDGSTFVMNGGVVAATNEDDHQSSSGGYDATALKVPAGCTATLNGGTINNVCDFTFAIDAAGTLNIPATSTLVVNGTHGAIAVSGGTTTIDAGTFQIPSDEYSRTDNVLYVSGGKLTVNGGTFIGDSDTASGGSCLCDTKGTAVVNGGTFKGSSGGDVWGTTGTTIKGGTFENLTEKQHIAEGCEMNENGEVVEAVKEVKVATLAELQAALASTTNDPIIITETIVIPEGETVVLDLNGKTVTRQDEANQYALRNLGDLTIKDTKGNGSINARGIYNGYGDGAANVATAKITVLSGTINAKGTNGGAAVYNYGIAEIKGGTFTSIGGYSLNSQSGASMTIADGVTANNGIYVSGATLVVDGGEISGNRSGCHVLYAWNSNVTIAGGTFHNNNSGNSTTMAGGTTKLTINGGTFSIANGKSTNGWTSCLIDATGGGKYEINGGEFKGHFRVQANCAMEINGGTFENTHGEAYVNGGTVSVKGGTFTDAAAQKFATDNLAENFKLGEDGKVVAAPVAAKIGDKGYETLEAAFAAAAEGATVTLLADATPALTSQRAITKASKIDLNGKTLTLTEDDLYFGDITFLNGNIVVDPSVKPSTAVFWMFKDQVLTFEYVKLTATGVTGTYLIGLDGNNADLNLFSSEIIVDNETALDLDIICVNATTGNDIWMEDSKVTVKNLDGRVFFRGNYTVAGNSEINLEGVTKAGFRIEAGQTLTIKDKAVVNIVGEPRDGGIHLTDASANYTKAETATVNATVNEPKVAKIGDTTYKTLQAAIDAVKEGETITLIDNVNVTTPAYGQNALNHAKAVSFTLDLNGKTLSANTGNSVFRFNIANSGATSNVTLTIKNGKIIAGSNTWCAVMAAGLSADVKAVMNLEDLTIEASKAGDLAVKAWDYAIVNANNVTVNATKGAGGFYAVGGEIVLDNCTVNQKGLHTAPYLSMAFAVSTMGKMTINSGTYSAEPTAAAEGNNQGSTHGSWVGGVMNSGGELIINGGTFSNGNFGDDALATAARGLIFADTNGKVTVNGGTFNALKSIFDFQNNLGTTSPVITVKGGNYSADPAKVTSYGSIVLEKGYDVVKNGNVWTVERGLAGAGTEAEPYLINNVSDLKFFRDEVNKGVANQYNALGVWVALAAEIDMTGENWVGIGSATKDHGFMGNFDGKNFKIKNLTITNPALDSDGYAYAGLFSVTEGKDKNNQNTIKNLIIENVTITTTGHIAAAAIAYPYYTIVDNVKVCGDIKIQGGDYTAGVLAYTRRCVNASNLSIVGDDGSFVKGGITVGGVISDIQMNGGLTAEYSNFSAEGIAVSGTKNVGGISGIIATQTLDVAVVKNVTLSCENGSVGIVSGALGGTSTITNVKSENVSGATTILGTSYSGNAIAAKIGDTYYATLEGALAAEGKEVELLATYEVAAGETKTLDLKGKTVTMVYTAKATKNHTMVSNSGNLTIESSVEGGKLSYTYAGENIGTSYSVNAVTSNPGSVLTVKSGTIENLTYDNSVIAYAIDGLTNGGAGDVTVNIEGGVITSKRQAVRIFANSTTNTGALNISGGDFTGRVIVQNASAKANKAALNITGGTFNANEYKTDVLYLGGSNSATIDINATVIGGTFNGEITDTNVKGFITGGTFANPVVAQYCATGYMPNKNTNGTYGVTEVANLAASVNGFGYATLAEAIDASTPETGWGGEVTLLKDVTLEGGYADASEGLRIEKSVTINGAGHTIDCGKFTKGIRIYQNGDIASNVMFKHVNIVNNNNQGRCIDTRSAKINLMLNGFVNLTAHGTNSQPLTIGGSEAMTKVTISASTIDAGTSGYAVICFVPVKENINVQNNAVIKGYAAFYLKEGVTNTAINLAQSTSIGTNKYAAASGNFGAIVIDGSNNAVRLEHRNAVVKAVAADGAEMAAQAAFFLGGNNNTVYYNNADAQVVTEGGQAYFVMANANVTGTKFNNNGVEMLLEAETRGYQFITVEDALRYANNGDTVKLLADAELDETYVNEKSLTLDLNGKTLSTAYVAGSTTNHIYAIDNKGTLTIKDSKGNGTINTRGIFNYGTMTLENGTINAIDGNGGYAVRNYAGSFTMNGGTIATTLEDDHQVNNGGYDATTVRVDEGATFTMNGGELNNICDYTFAIDNYGEVTVNGGTVTSVHSTVSNYGTVTINGGSFTCNGLEGVTAHVIVAWDGSTTTINDGTFDGKDNYNGFNVDATKGANVVIKGGNFLSVHSGSLYGDGTITVSGGTFFDKISDQRCELGFQAVVNTEGTYDVKYTGIRDAYTIVDGEYESFNIDMAEPATIGTLTYERTFKNAGVWQTLYVPFEIPVSELTDDYEVAYVNDVQALDWDENGTVDLSEIVIEYVKIKNGTLRANHPYVIKPKNEAAKEMELVLYDAKLYGTSADKQVTIDIATAYTKFNFKGNYSKAPVSEIGVDGKAFTLNNSGKWMNLGTASLGAFRVYMTMENKDGSPVIIPEGTEIRSRVVGEKDEATGIITPIVEGDVRANDGAIYDLNGRPVRTPEKGKIYIMNGKKVLF